ncbi:MAG: hypothetical protein V2A62_02080 [Candidatus Woesearchaeota archaeon]
MAEELKFKLGTYHYETPCDTDGSFVVNQEGDYLVIHSHQRLVPQRDEGGRSRLVEITPKMLKEKLRVEESVKYSGTFTLSCRYIGMEPGLVLDLKVDPIKGTWTEYRDDMTEIKTLLAAHVETRMQKYDQKINRPLRTIGAVETHFSGIETRMTEAVQTLKQPKDFLPASQPGDYFHF